MPTIQYLEIWRALAAPFDPDEVRVRPQGTRQIQYVTARTVMNRLDEVLGPGGWWDDYTPLEHSVICRLTIKLPDGTTLTKCDAGGYAGMSDQGDDDKSGFSDSYKRAAVKFGVARYLYRDGTPRWPAEEAPGAKAPEAEAAGTPEPAKAARKGPPCNFAGGEELFRYLNGRTELDLVSFLAWLREEYPGMPDRLPKWSKAQLLEAWPRIVTKLRACKPGLKVAGGTSPPASRN